MPSIESTRPRSRIDHEPHAPPPPARPENRARPTPRATDHAVDANVVAAALNDRVLYLGMNESSVPAESRALGANAIILRGSSTNELSTPRAVRDFVQTLAAQKGLTLPQCEKLERVLLGEVASGRDELAKMAAVWATAEGGAAVPSRLVLSGHSSYGMLWGDHDVGTIRLEAVRDLGKIFPKAAAQIEDVHISGCFSEDQVQHAERWTESFPNLKTIWAYGGFSPKPAAGDLAAWQAATLGRTTRLSEGLVASHGSATAWSIGGGIAHATASVEERRQLVEEADRHFDAYFTGSARIPDPHDPAADRDYGAYQMLASHREATPDERRVAGERGAQMLRLRFWESSVRGEIASRYGAQINDALTNAGLAPVDFHALSRKDALAVIDRYRDVKGSLGPIMTGVVELSPDVIPASFCH
jgi:hypothetical protein